MAGTTIDRMRAQRLLQDSGLDALVLFQPEHVSWAIGTHPGPASLFRRAGAAIAIVPRDPALGLVAIMPDLAAGAVRLGCAAARVVYHPVWVGTGSVREHGVDEPLGAILAPPVIETRPETFDAEAAFALLRAELAALGLADARLGIDAGFVPAADHALLAGVLGRATLADGTDALRRLRMVKTPAEIARLRTAAALGEAGYRHALGGIGPKVTREALSARYAEGVRSEASRRAVGFNSFWDYISVGPDPWGAGRPAEPGDVIKFDLGTVVGGLSSDFARTVVVGAPSRAARDLHAALLEALETGLAMLRPGVPLRDIHGTMLETVRRAGVPGYARGHFGHSLGNDPFSEQWPFISADCPVVAEQDMVLAVEAPFYVDGLGGFIVEDQVLVTAGGHELMTVADRSFRSF